MRIKECVQGRDGEEEGTPLRSSEWMDAKRDWNAGPPRRVALSARLLFALVWVLACATRHPLREGDETEGGRERACRGGYESLSPSIYPLVHLSNQCHDYSFILCQAVTTKSCSFSSRCDRVPYTA